MRKWIVSLFLLGFAATAGAQDFNICTGTQAASGELADKIVVCRDGTPDVTRGLSLSQVFDILSGEVTCPAGVCALAVDVVAPAEMADADHGDVAWSAGVATVQASAALSAEIDTDVSTHAGDADAHGSFLLDTGDTMTGELVVDELGLEFTPGTVLTDCSTFSATGGGIWFDDAAGKFQKCEDGVQTDLDTDTAGSGIASVVEDTSPQLGGNLDVQARSIVTSTTNGDIAITPDGTGQVVIGGGGLEVSGASGLIQGNGTAALNIDGNGQNTTLGDGGTNGVQVTDAGAMTAIGTGSIEATAVAANAVGNVGLSATFTVCTQFTDLAAADDDQFIYSSGTTITLVSAYAHCQGTCTTEADFTLEYVEVGTAGPTVTAVTGTITAEDYVTGDSATTLSGNTTLTALDVLRADVSNTPDPTTDEYSLCVNFTY